MLDSAVNMLTAAPSILDAMETMGDRIKMLREARNYTVEELAAQIGVTRGLVYQWESDSVVGIRPVNFVRLYTVLHTTGEYLVYGADGPPKGGSRPQRDDSTVTTGRFRRPS